MNAVIAGVRSRNRVRSPWESMATPGQKVSSKRKKTLRRAMMMWRWAKADVLTHSRRAASASELNEDLLELWLVDLALADEHALLHEPAQDLGQPLVDGVDGALDALAPHLELQDAGELADPLGDGGVEAQRDHVADPDLALERVGAALGEDALALDERDGVAQLFRFPHVVGREDDGGAPLAPQLGDLRADADRHVGIEPERRLVEEEHLGLVEQGLGEGQPLLQPRRQLVVLGALVGLELAALDQLPDPTPERGARQPIEAAVEAQHLGGPQAPHEGGVARCHIQPTAHGERIADDVVP